MGVQEGTAPTLTANRGEGFTILVVDDEPPLLRLLEFLLQRQGYQVLTATDGVAAMEILQTVRPDLLVLDVMMPRMDGYQVAEAVRADARLAEIPIIMLTAKAQDEDEEQGRIAGADVYLTKPFEPDALAERISRFLSR